MKFSSTLYEHNYFKHSLVYCILCLQINPVLLNIDMQMYVTF